jgi:hypothetical protein
VLEQRVLRSAEAFCRHVAAIHNVDDRTWQASVRELRPTPRAVILHELVILVQ